ncbi:hypothetical protein, partial [Bacillus subtilis]|uniref:hypothetical protein n=1 Tax=Bacillus subtilis TaxID=1423 RepID=UPI00397F36B1
MKTARTRAVAPMPRPSMHAPLSAPRLRFMPAGPERGEGTAGSSAESPVDDSGDSGQPSASDASDDAGSKQVDDEQGERPSQADDPKLRAARDEAYQNRIKAREAKEAADTAAQEKDALIQSIGKALGLIKDNDEAAPDADALTAQVA